MTNQHPRTPEYPLLNFVLAIGAFAAAYWLLTNQRPDAEWYGVAGLVAGLMGLGWLRAAIAAQRMHTRMRRANKAMDDVGTSHGSARWGTLRDAIKAGLRYRGYLELGTLEGKRLWKNHEGAAVIISPPGGGKTSSLVMPQLLREQRDEHGDPMSIVVLDVSGEIQSVSARRQRELGREVASIVPHYARLSEEMGVEITDRGFNPLAVLSDAGEEAKDLAWRLAQAVLPDDPKASGSSKYFNTAAQRMLLFLNLYMAYRGEPSLAEARRLAMGSAEAWDLVFAEAMTTDAYGGTLAQLATRFNDTRVSENEWTGIINTVLTSLEIFDDFGPIGRSTSVRDGFDFGKLKDGPPTTVFLTLPPEYMVSHGAWLNVVLTAGIEQMMRVRTNRKVLLLLDEIMSTGLALPEIFRIVAVGRKYGLVPVLYLQSYNQVSSIYGESRTHELFSMCELVMSSGVRDRETCRWLSQLTGTRTIGQTTHNVRPDLTGSGGPDYSSSKGAHGRPLLLPEEVRELPEHKALTFFKNAPPFLLDTTPYFRNPKLRRHADPNPFYRKS